MMKLVLALSFLAASASAFSVQAPNGALRPDSATAVEEALKITASFGIDSNEAKVAWDTVEEIDASDNSAATMPGMDEECSIDETSEQSIKCMDYGRFLDELYTLRDLIGGENKAMSKTSLVNTLKMIQLKAPKAATTTTSPELTAALEEAKEATAKHGASSVEARLAWETYEEIAANGLGNEVRITLAEECSIESGQEVCQAMDEIDRVMPVLLAMNMHK